MKKKNLCAVLCYNNEKIIQYLINDLKKNKKTLNTEFIFIDDFSIDKTYEKLKINKLNIIRHKFNKGYGGAVKTAFNFAILKNYDFLYIFPGDYQRSINDLSYMIKLNSKFSYDLISGSKFKKIQVLPTHRKIGNLFYSKLAKFLWNSQLTDVLSGFKSYKVKKFKNFINNLPNNYSFDILLNQKISDKKLYLKEFDADVKYNNETSKMKGILLFHRKNILLVGYNMLFISIQEYLKSFFNKKF